VSPLPGPDDHLRTVQGFLDAYANDDAHLRTTQLGELCTADVLYRDPLARTAGVEELSAHFTDLRSRSTAHRLTLASTVDRHHDVARFAWTAYDGAGQRVLAGIDIAEFDVHNRLRIVTAFFGPLAPRTYTFGTAYIRRGANGL
jgi:hypothetical protein